jgi:hypothetical protein
VTETKELLGIDGRGRVVIGRNGTFELKESGNPYNRILRRENEVLRLQNDYPWEVFD